MLLTFGVPAGVAAAGPQPLADITLEFLDPATGATQVVTATCTVERSAEGAAAGQAPNPLVLTTAARYETVRVIEQANKMHENDDADAAVQLLNDYASRLGQLGATAPAESAQQLGVFSSQARVVAQTITEAKHQAKYDMNAKNACTSVATAAYQGLRDQRVANVGHTSALPQAQLYDNKSKARTRTNAGTYVDQGMRSKFASAPPGARN